MMLSRLGTVTVSKAGISVDGFEGKNASCRDVAIMGAAWAIGELQREMLKTIKKPGGGNISVD
ncbi:Uncharacterised protein [Pseudomonas putida]|nr:Uncharacterised protein [Pseudomonas putida]CAB5577952.1 Uncharacterised protein [Pseudomonas putida]CAB5620967.1 Uncharacterised protein [Pseudomonas putida]CAB5622478.1 Uncharacterised protein [Pseudomonas putida]CAB5702428.1 Uncharacterised protein [Pseudomonas putida]